MERRASYTRCRLAIQRERRMVKPTVTHEADHPHKLIEAVSEGWPRVLLSLKTLLETGSAPAGDRRVPERMTVYVRQFYRTHGRQGNT